MKILDKISFTLLAGALVLIPSGSAFAQNEMSNEDYLAVVHSVIQADRQATVAQAMQLTEAEAEEFWPLYREYRTDLSQIGDGLQKLVLDYAELYPNVPEDRAKKMLKELMKLEKEQVSKRAWYFKKFGRIIPADKTLRFVQIENRLNLALQLQLASEIPIVPIEGKIAGEGSESVAVVEGIAGGIQVRTTQWNATVAAIDQAKRKLTLVGVNSIKETVKAGPEVVNFDQIRVGDKLTVTTTEKLVVALAGTGESVEDGVTDVVVLAPRGAKPSAAMAETTQITGKVTAIDRGKRTATLRFEDGSNETFPVRADIDLSQYKVGDQVVFRVTEMLAISVRKQ